MSALFISHASSDAEAAREVAARLERWGWSSLFVDVDPEHGLRAGVAWESELYRRLRMARALIAVVSSAFLDSRWCFAEVTQARALGKPVFPLRIEPCELGSLLADRQAVDLTEGDEESWERLRRGLETVLGGDLSFDSDRPYPGLASFEPGDAGVFFGREEEQTAVIDALERMRRRGESRLAVVLGASGSGKSSLVKAGVLPRLARDRQRWLVVPPMRPGDAPGHALARAFAAAFDDLGASRGWREIADLLAAEAEPDALHPWSILAEDLREAAGERDAAVLLTLDQMEELLAPTSAAVAERHAEFRRRLRSALDDPDGPLTAVATLRSDFLGLFQLAAELRDLPFEDLPLGPMPIERLQRVIVAPAERVGVEFEEDLVRRLIADTGSADALPLLAFTLRELWERHEGDAITEALYEQRLGSIEGAIARIAESIGGGRDAAEERALRSAFLRMVRLDDEGRFVRRPVSWQEIPEGARPPIQRFVDEHLLVSDTVDGERRIEVAHEALFRAWTRLAGWLDQERELLLFRQRLGRARDEWARLKEDSSALLDGAALAEAERWAEERGDELEEQQLAFVARSVERRDRELAAARRRRRWVVGGLAAGLLVAVALAMLATREWLRAEQQRRIAEARQLAAAAESAEPLRALLLATESLRAGWTYEGYAVWARTVSSFLPGPARRLEVEGRVTALVAHPSDPRLAFADDHGIVRIIEPNAGQEVASLPVDNPASVHELTFSPDGRWLAAGHGDRIAVWSTGSWEPAADLDGFGHTHDIAFSPDGELLAAAQREVFLGPVSTRTWRLPRPRVREPGDFALAVAFSPDGLELAIGGESTLEVWRRSESSAEWPEELRSSSTLVTRVCRLGHRFDGLVVCGDTAEPPALLEFAPSSASRWNLIQGPGDRSSDRRWVARPEATGVALLGVLPEDRRAWLPTRGEATVAAFTADDRWLVTGGGGLETWNLEQAARVGATLRLRVPRAEALAFSPDGSWLAVCDQEETIRLFATDSWRQEAALDASCAEIGFAADERLVTRDQRAVVLTHAGGTWRTTGSIATVPSGASIALSPDRRWARIHRPYADALRYRELLRPSRTSIVDLDTGRVVAWRTNEEQDIEDFLEEAGRFHRGLTRERIVVRWETDDASGEKVELGAWGDQELLETSDEWPTVSFERATTSPDDRWAVTDDGGGSSLDGTLYEPGSGREIASLVRGRTLDGTAIESAAFSPDLGHGSEWVAFGTGGGVALWRLGPVQALIEETCARVSRNLEPDEWPLDSPPPITCPGS